MQSKRITQGVMFKQIEQVLGQGRPTDPPAYTLVLGAGASAGIVPTAREMLGIAATAAEVHPRSIPTWLHERRSGAPVLPEERLEIVRAFWRNFMEANPDLERSAATSVGDSTSVVALENGIPSATSVAAAYTALFDQNRAGGLNTPAQARDFLRDLTLSPEQTRLNATHFYLASLLALQNQIGRGASGDQMLYIGRRPFARTLFTTNFDPLLQVALQLFHLLYYMTDRPEQLAADALDTDHHAAIHLFYAHGSVHRPFLANAPREIQYLERNSRDLASYLGRHGVIVLGYSGWDDSLLRAMNETPSFAHNLYWLTRGEASLSPAVRDLLASHANAFWVDIQDGGSFLADLHRTLCPGAANTEILRNPLGPLLRQLRGVNLVGIPAARILAEVALRPNLDRGKERAPTNVIAEPQLDLPRDAQGILAKVVALLEETERRFANPEELRAPAEELERQADLAYANNDWAAALRAYDELLKGRELSSALRAEGTRRRGYCRARLADFEGAIVDFTVVLGMREVSGAVRAKALLNRGGAYGGKGDRASQIADYDAIMAMTDAPSEQRAAALVSRGWYYGQNGEVERQLADYDAVLEMTDAPVADRAYALMGRGFIHHEAGRTEQAVADYSAVLEMADAPAEHRVEALLNRGVLRGDEGRQELAITDYGAVLEIKEATAEQRANALFNRAFAHAKCNRMEQAIADYSAVADMKDAPGVQRARALVNRGWRYGAKGESDKAIADYSAVIDARDAPADQRAKALVNRASHQSDSQRALADYGTVLGMHDAPREQHARALHGRALVYRAKGEVERAKADYRAMLEIPEAPVEMRRQATLALAT